MRVWKKHWDRWYARLTRPVKMGLKSSYRLAVEFLDQGGLIEDWGGGTGYARQFVQHSNYRVVDGSPSTLGDVVAELEQYRSSVDAILIRHVLEHNHEWRSILDNALKSFRSRMCVVLFTEPAETTHEVTRGRVPEYRFRLSDLTERFPPDVEWESRSIRNETLLYLMRREHD